MQALCTYAPVPVSAFVLFIGCAVFTSVRLFTPDMVQFQSMSATMQNDIIQYTHRYSYVNWVRAAPRHPHCRALAGLSAPRIRSQASCERRGELHVSVAFTVIAEACEATAVEFVGVVVKLFADVCLFVRVQNVEFFQHG